MTNDSNLPILDHPLDHPSAFTAQDLINDVRRRRQISTGNVPAVCILEFDGDLTDWLVREGVAKPFAAWACFHTAMFAMDLEGITCGIIARTIGGPYAVLIAEQLHAAGAKLIIGLTSAGRVSPELPLPCLVVATSAIRDEGTSYHYLPPSKEVVCNSQVVSVLERELITTGWATRSEGLDDRCPVPREQSSTRRVVQGGRTCGRDASGVTFCIRHRAASLSSIRCDGKQCGRSLGDAV